MIKFKKGDIVHILKGKDRGKSGKILKVLTEKGKVLVEGINQLKKNIRPKREGEKGQIITVSHPVPASNIAFICTHCRKPTRLGMKIDGKTKKKYCKKCQAMV